MTYFAPTARNNWISPLSGSPDARDGAGIEKAKPLEETGLSIAWMKRGEQRRKIKDKTRVKVEKELGVAGGRYRSAIRNQEVRKEA